MQFVHMLESIFSLKYPRIFNVGNPVQYVPKPMEKDTYPYVTFATIK